MARKLENQINVDAPSGDYPSGRVRNDSGVGDGTPVTEKVHGDHHQFFAKLLRDAAAAFNSLFVINDLPDNTTDGFQLDQALGLNAAKLWKDVNLNGTYNEVQPLQTLREYDGVRMRGIIEYTNVSGTTVATTIELNHRPQSDRRVAIDIFDTGAGTGVILARAHVIVTAAGEVQFSDLDYPGITGNDSLYFEGSYYRLED